jgi:hypothetical protein
MSLQKMELGTGSPCYVLGYGPGTVTRVLPDGSFVVNVPGRGERTYTSYGTFGSGPDRKVYYHNPILFEPPKDPSLWRAWKRIAIDLFGSLSLIYGQGDAPAGQADDVD